MACWTHTSVNHFFPYLFSPAVGSCVKPELPGGEWPFTRSGLVGPQGWLADARGPAQWTCMPWALAALGPGGDWCQSFARAQWQIQSCSSLGTWCDRRKWPASGGGFWVAVLSAAGHVSLRASCPAVSQTGPAEPFPANGTGCPGGGEGGCWNGCRAAPGPRARWTLPPGDGRSRPRCGSL